MKDHHRKKGLRDRLFVVIFEADTPAGKAFDVALLVFILLSILVVMLESVSNIRDNYGTYLTIAEWVLTIGFTIEYILRIYTVKKPFKYIFSFFGIIDLLAILPTYLSLLFVGSQYLLTIRALRLLRIFRIFKMTRYISESQRLGVALWASRRKILIFLFAVMTVVTIIGSAMYLIEGGEENTAFTSIPRSMYWAIVTMTTVGFGDITPQTNVGQFLSAVLMILGYAVIAVPTGIVSVEVFKDDDEQTTEACPHCSKEGHDPDAVFCKYCGGKL